MSGGTFNVAGGAYVGRAGNGYITQSGGDISIGGNVSLVNGISNASLTTMNEGQYTISGGTMTVTGDVINGDWAVVTSKGIGQSTVSVHGSAGTFTVQGNYSTGAEDITPWATDASGLRHSFFNALIDAGGLTSIGVAGNVTLDGTFSLAFDTGVSLVDGQQFTLFDVGGTTTGQFIGLDEGALVGNYDGVDLFITYAGGSGQNDVVLYTPSAIPEPATLGLLAFGGLVMLKRRK